jgi:hypothetical protein
MAFAGSASAATITSPTGTEYTGLITESFEGSVLIEAGFANITCTTGTVAGRLTTNTETEAAGEITTVSFSNCGSATVDTLNHKGTFTITKAGTTVTGTGVEVTIAVFGTSCVYGFGGGTHLGTATNTTVSGVDIVTTDTSANVPKITGGFLCASPARFTGSSVITSPAQSYIH